jgi:hypothetical protein
MGVELRVYLCPATITQTMHTPQYPAIGPAQFLQLVMGKNLTRGALVHVDPQTPTVAKGLRCQKSIDDRYPCETKGHQLKDLFARSFTGQVSLVTVVDTQSHQLSLAPENLLQIFQYVTQLLI